MNSKTRARPLRSRERTRQPENVALQPQLLVLTAQPDQLIALSRTQGLALFLPASADQIDRLTTELREIRRTGSGQLMSLL